MGRHYFHCPRCRKRMKMFKRDTDDQRRFYLCKECGNRCVYHTVINGLSDDWPRDIFDEVVACGVIDGHGRVLDW